MCKIIAGETYGFKTDVWEKAKKEAIRGILREGLKGKLIFYSDLTKQISSIAFDPHGYEFRHLLGQISSEEEADGRGMLTALVVLKEKGVPGDGYWDLAAQLGRDVSDKLACWAKEVEVVFEQCKRHPLAK